MKDIEAKFSEIEKRVRGLVSENADLRKRVSQLEQELALVRREALNMEHFHGKKMHIKEKIERILNSLENAGVKE